MPAKKIEEPQQDETIKVPSYLEAYLALQGDVEAMTKSEDNPFFKSNYVALPSMLTALKPALQKHRFILSQPVEYIATENGVHTVVISRIIYAPTGQGNESKLVIPKIDDMQKLGGAITYARRYTLSALLSLIEQDDDGNTAVGNKSVKVGKGKPKTKTVNLEEW